MTPDAPPAIAAAAVFGPMPPRTQMAGAWCSPRRSARVTCCNRMNVDVSPTGPAASLPTSTRWPGPDDWASNESALSSWPIELIAGMRTRSVRSGSIAAARSVAAISAVTLGGSGPSGGTSAHTTSGSSWLAIG